ncbi:hypothetical protein FisN_5Lh333 [Fistulifera solaris]|uniref:Uncharacterized protein n=1 Tax=Fistulifera solaris TaxID=1519565 RepID=A0A1Z5KGR7_FISSO|nr:hypothetical protein FisN_5Lh333 [Fistulifera solaris]|eukprot:GAX25251.1 hypothetical protein FisN_5Lh333 [Fistulifera solaris]
MPSLSYRFSAYCTIAALGTAVAVYALQEARKANKITGRKSGGGRLPAPRRHAAVIRLRIGKYQQYRELHDNVWEAVLERMYKSNIRNFSIYYHEEYSTLYQSFEWIGHWTFYERYLRFPTPKEEQELFASDMKAISDDPVTREWWKECEPCQVPFSQWTSSTSPSEGGNGNWWAPLECVAFCGHWPTRYSEEKRDPDFACLDGKWESIHE